MNWNRIIQSVPNFSEGRDLDKVEKIVSAFRGKKGVKLLDYSSDSDHNRTVVTVIGEPQQLIAALLESAKTAIELIDLNLHQGQHPRIGAIDVIPFIPIKNFSMEETIELSKELAQQLANKLNLPVYLYEKSASTPNRENLARIRKGNFEGLNSKMKEADWLPDYGPNLAHATAGAVVIGARMPLIAYNINLNTTCLKTATQIARDIRYINGGLRYVKAMALMLENRKITQVSINLTDYTETSIYRVFELVRIEAKRYGISIIGSEIIGLVPMGALIDVASYYLRLEDFNINQVLETQLME